jgi:ABC-type uncharacterized transport system permease subunit
VMLAIWSAVAREAPVGRFGQKDFVAYYLAALVVRLLTGAWVVWELTFEVRQGTLAYRLLRRRTDLTLTDLAVLVLCEIAELDRFKINLAQAIRRDQRFVRVSRGRYVRSQLSTGK